MGAATSQISYTASKGGVLALSRELGVEFARRGVRVNALCPGPVDTPLLRELFAKDPERAARRLVHVPMGRFGDASEIASAALFLASDDSSFVTASSLLVDGGISGAYVTPLSAGGAVDTRTPRRGDVRRIATNLAKPQASAGNQTAVGRRGGRYTAVRAARAARRLRYAPADARRPGRRRASRRSPSSVQVTGSSRKSA